MDHNLRQLEKELHEASLTNEERARLKTRLVVFMHDQPYVARHSFSFGHFFNTHVVRLAPVFTILIIFLGGGVSQIAESSLPGDLLYPIKTNINEEIKGFLATSPESAVRFEVDLAERRVSELEQIAVPVTVQESVAMPVPELMLAPMQKTLEHNAPSQAEIKKDTKRKKQEETATKLEQALQSHVLRAEEQIQKIESVQGETKVTQKARAKLRGVNERRQKTKSSVHVEAPTLMISAPVDDGVTISGDRTQKNKKNERSFKGKSKETIQAPQQNASFRVSPEATPTLLQGTPALTGGVEPELSCLSDQQKLEGAEYTLRRIEDLRVHVSKHKDSLGKKYVRETNEKLSGFEKKLSKIKSEESSEDSKSSLHKDIAGLEQELVGTSCLER